jgi:hypothetical protein
VRRASKPYLTEIVGFFFLTDTSVHAWLKACTVTVADVFDDLATREFCWSVIFPVRD